MRLALWRLIGRLEVDDRRLLRYTVTFGRARVAQSVVDWAGHGRRYRGQVRWVGSSAWYGLSLMGAPDDIVALARECRGKPDEQEFEQFEELMKTHHFVGLD